MKKVLSLILAIMMMTSLAACNNSAQTTSPPTAPASTNSPEGSQPPAEPVEEPVNYPEGGVLNIVCAYSAGGTTDVVGRELGALMAEYLNCDVNVTNVTGGNASVAGIKVDAENTGDGSQVLLCVPSMPSSWALSGYTDDIGWEDFYYFYVCGGPYIMLVSADSPFNTLDDLVAYAKDHPGELTSGNSGIGSLVHLSGTLLYRELGIDIVAVPYSGGRETCTKVMSGECDIFWGALPDITDYIKSGDVKPLVISTVEDATLAGPNGDIVVSGIGKAHPSIPTIIDALSAWGIMMPRETEDKYVKAFAKAFEACATSEEFITFCSDLGAVAMCAYGAEADEMVVTAQSILTWGQYDMGITAEGLSPEDFGIQKPDEFKLSNVDMSIAKPFPG